MSNTKLRIISAIVMMLILVFFSLIGNQGILFVIFGVGLLLVDEFVVNILQNSRGTINYLASVLSFGIGYYFFNYIESTEIFFDLLMNFAILMNFLLLIYLFVEKMEEGFTLTLLKKFSFLAGIFILVPMMSLAQIVHREDWIMLSLFLVVFNFSVDTGAWFFGKKYGNKKLWPSISPKKTINGALGGSLFAVSVASCISYFAMGKLNVLIIIAFFILSCFAQLGDLIESKLKRQAGIKDSSNLIPGHGGIYDRVDSLIFVAPFFVLVIKYLY